MATTEELYATERALWFNYLRQTGAPADIAAKRADHSIDSKKKSRAAAKKLDDNRKAGITPPTPSHNPAAAMKSITDFYERNPTHQRGF